MGKKDKERANQTWRKSEIRESVRVENIVNHDPAHCRERDATEVGKQERKEGRTRREEG